MRRNLAVALVAILALTLTAACSDDDEAASPCSAAQDLSASVQSLAEVDVVEEGTSGVEAAVDDVQQQWEAFDDASRGQFSSQIDALGSAIDQLEDALGSISGDDIGGSATQVGEAITAVSEAWTSLAAAITSEFSSCDLSGSGGDSSDTSGG